MCVGVVRPVDALGSVVVVDALADWAPQSKIAYYGNKYLQDVFPLLTTIVKVDVTKHTVEKQDGHADL